MIPRICIILVGVLLAVVAALFWKKLPAAWRAALVAGAVLTAGIGGLFTYGFWQQECRDREYVYLSLRYLENSDTESAMYYLKKVNRDSFESLCAESLLETMRNNTVLARMKLDAAESKAKTTSQEALSVKMSTLGSDAQSWQSLITPIRDSISLSEKQAARMDARFNSESNYYVEGSVQMDDESLWDEEESLRQRISRDLSSTSYASALSAAAQLVDESASSQNRLMLAEAIAEATYAGYEFSGTELSVDGTANDSADQERSELGEQLEQVNKQLDDITTLLSSETDETNIQEMTRQKEELTLQQSDLQNSYNYIYALRAFNSIADLHTLDAEIVRARLHYAMNNYAQATDLLQQTGNSLAAKLTTNVPLRNAFHVINSTYQDTQAFGAQSEEFRSAVKTVLTTGAVDYVGISTTPLTESFTTYVISELKQYGRDLYATSINLDNFPEVVVTLSGRDTLIKKLVEQQSATVRDTRQDVEYTIQALSDEEAKRNVICVVDESGSMDGEPLQNAQNALSGFIDSLDENLSMALVSFDDTARLRAPMGSDKTTLLAAVDEIGNSGGTDITAGIQMAMQAAEGSEQNTTVLLMTDGQSNIDMSVVEDAASRGMVIHTIGFGSVDDALLQSIADATGGQYIRADSSTELISVYLSLVGMIGNQVEVRYTAPELPGETQRYFFLRMEEDNTSVHVDYSTDKATNTAPVINSIDRPVLYPQELSQAQQDGTEIWTYMYGEHLSNVIGVTVSGQPANLDAENMSDTGLRVQLPTQLSAGWQTIELTESDGTVTSFDRLLVVGDTINCYNFSYGRMHIRSYGTVLLPDGTLVINGASIDDSTDTGDRTVRTLDMRVSGLLWAQVDAASVLAAAQTLDFGQEFPLNTGAPIEGSGSVQLTGNDSGYDNNVSSTVADGRYQLQADGDQIKLIEQ